MGSYVSKLLARNAEETTEPKAKACSPEDLLPCTPVEAKKLCPIDPRSATAGIPRTPIEINYTPPNTNRRIVSAIPPYLQKKPYLETDLDNISFFAPRKGSPSKLLEVGIMSSPILHNQPPKAPQFDIPTIDVTGDTPINELRYKILGIDPRSPAVDFDRTPILAPKLSKNFKARSHENLTRRESYDELGITPQARLSYCETMTLGNIPEVLALPDIIANLNKSLNFDSATENSDQFDSCSSSSENSVETISDSGEEITVIPNPNVKSTQDVATNVKTSLGASIEKIQDPEEVFYPADNIDRVLSIATRAAEKQQSVSDVERKITVWRDSISPEVTETPGLDAFEDSESTQSDVIAIPKEEVMIEFDDAEIIKTLKVQPNKKEEGVQVEEAKAKKPEFGERKNKKIEPVEGRVFFQEKIFTPDGKNNKQAPKVRTPLGNRSNNHSKVVNNMPMKSPQQLLRAKAMSTKLHQENTPPRSMKPKLNGTQWDPDSTVLI